MVDTINFGDHQRLKFQAAEEGLSYRDFRSKLRLHDIPLEEAIQNAKDGVSVSQYVQERVRTQRRFRNIIYGAIAASIIGLFYSIATSDPAEIYSDKKLTEIHYGVGGLF